MSQHSFFYSFHSKSSSCVNSRNNYHMTEHKTSPDILVKHRIENAPILELIRHSYQPGDIVSLLQLRGKYCDFIHIMFRYHCTQQSFCDLKWNIAILRPHYVSSFSFPLPPICFKTSDSRWNEICNIFASQTIFFPQQLNSRDAF